MVKLAFLLVILLVTVAIIVYVFLSYSAMNASHHIISSNPTMKSQPTSKLYEEINPQLISAGFNRDVQSSKLRKRFSDRLVVDKYSSVGSDKNRADIAYSLALLKSGRCRHIYLDLGTNIGVQIRKLYQANLFPYAPALTFFDKYFGKFNSELRKNICSFGFEANPKWTDRLKQLEKNYRLKGIPLVIFTEMAVGVYNGNMSFFEETDMSEEVHDWGASTIQWKPQMKKVNVGSIDIASFLYDVFNRYGRDEGSRVLSKLDIEGGEYSVISHLLSEKAICPIDFMYFELHPHLVPGSPEIVPYFDSLRWILKQIPGCRCNITIEDDESYSTGIDMNDMTNASVAAKGSGQNFFILHGGKRYLSSRADLQILGIDPDTVVHLPDKLILSFPKAAGKYVGAKLAIFKKR